MRPFKFNTIESTTEIRNRLSSRLKKISRLDPLPYERKLTKTIKKKLQKKHGSLCGYCGINCSPDAAHIIPLEIGARTTEDNIILLCESCHKFYDRGHISINAMSKIAAEWRKGIFPKKSRIPLNNINPPKPSITIPPDSLREIFNDILQMQRECKYVKAIETVNRALDNNKLTEAEKIYLLIKRAELFRRRSAKSVVQQSFKYLLEINTNKIPQKYLPVYYYELNYVNRLMGNHKEAAKLIQQSAKASLACSNNKPKVDYVAALANEILCNLAEIEKLSAYQEQQFERKLKRLKIISQKCGEYWGGRWNLNCTAHALQVRIKANDGRGSWELLEELKKIYFDSDVTNGWDSAGFQTLSLLEGLVYVLFPQHHKDIRHGIELLARSFMTRLGPRQRPEGIRDVGFGFSIGMRKTKNKHLIHLSKHIKEIMNQTVDGTSVLWPWRAIDKRRNIMKINRGK